MSGRRVARATRSIVNARDLQLECSRVRQFYGGRRRDLRLLGIRRMNRVSNILIRGLCGVRKGLDQGWGTCGLKATFGLLSHKVWPYIGA